MRKLRSLCPERGGRIPAATLSAAANTRSEIALWRAAGFQESIRKPFSPPHVVAVVEALAGHWVERRAAVLDRCEWPTPRERRSERRAEPPSAFLDARAGSNGPLLRELC